MALFLLATFHVAMAAPGYVVELVFGVIELVRGERRAKAVEPWSP